MPKLPAKTLRIDRYDCIGFDLDHTLCRYNIGPMVRLEYDLLADFLINRRGYDPAIRDKTFDDGRDLVCKGLTLDCERGNLLRLHVDGFVLAAAHGSRQLTGAEIERIYGRCRKKHPGHSYSLHLAEFGRNGVFLDYSCPLRQENRFFQKYCHLLGHRIQSHACYRL